MGDRLHQPFRGPLVPGLEQAINLEHEDLLGICLSGAGPSIVAIAEKNLESVARLLATTYDATGIKYQVRKLKVHPEIADEDQPAFAGACCA
jgi:homoserine kinase